MKPTDKDQQLVHEEMYWCSRCKEKVWVSESYLSDVPVPECPFCENTDKVRSTTE